MTFAADPAALPAPSAERALVVGATGYVGRALVRELRARGVTVLAHGRAESPRLARLRGPFADLGAEVVTTAFDREALALLLTSRAVTHVFLCLGTTLRRSLGRGAGGRRDTYESVDLALSSLVIGAAVDSGLAPRVVLLSTAGARAASRWRYFAVRGRLEQVLMDSPLPWTIARPGHITGPDRDEWRPLERLSAMITDWTLLWLAVLGMQILRERYRPIGAGELAKALAQHGFDPHSVRKILPGERLRDFP